MNIGPFNFQTRKQRRLAEAQIKEAALLEANAKFYSGSQGIRGGNLNAINHPIFPFLNDCTGGKYGTDPRQRMGLYRLLDEVLPIYNQSIKWSVFALGQARPVSEDKGIQRELDRFFRDFQIKYDHDQEFAIEQGFSNYLTKLLEEAQGTDGMAFGELFRQSRRGPVTGVVSRDAAMFEYLCLDGKNWKLYMYTNDGGQIELKPSSSLLAWSSGHPAREGQFWGRSNKWGTETSAQHFLKFMVGRDGVHERTGDPVTWHMMFANSDTEMAITPTTKAAFVTAKDRAQSEYAELRNYAHKTGRGGDMWSTFPQKLGYEKHTHGEGVAIPNDFPEEYDLLLKDVSRHGRTPAIFLDFKRTGSALGSNEFDVAADQLISIAKHDHMRLAPVANKIMNAFLISIGASESQIEGASIEWDIPDLQDIKKRWEAAKLEAETTGVQITNFEAIGMNLARAEQANYAEEIGRPDLMIVDAGE